MKKFKKKIAKQKTGVISKCDSLFDELHQMLIEKNKKYGDSALKPKRSVFSKLSPSEGILLRANDKFNRIEEMGGLGTYLKDSPDKEDAINDLIGYLMLLKIVVKKDN